MFVFCLRRQQNSKTTYKEAKKNVEEIEKKEGQESGSCLSLDKQNKNNEYTIVYTCIQCHG